jgi:hypothetical protein
VDPVMPAALDGLRVTTTLLRYPVEVTYRIRGSGSGVTALQLNDASLSFTYADNPHRRGAALVVKSEVVNRLRAQRNALRIDLG